MSPSLRIIHYLNQYFSGIGGEEKAYELPQVRDGFINLGRSIQNELKEKGRVVATITCGDNFFVQKMEEAVQEILQMMIPYKPDVLIAGPAFNAGRYGVACGHICKAVQDSLGITAITGMFEENPGVDLYRRDVYIVKTAESARGIDEVISRMVKIALKLNTGDIIGKPAQEGYFTRGIIKNEPSEKTAAERAVTMVLAKIAGEYFEPELEVPDFDRMNPASAIEDITSAEIGLVTDGGLVPKGNPDKMKSHKSTGFGSYSISALDSLSPKDFEANHIGYDTAFIDQDPNRLVPLDVMRVLEKKGVIGKLHDSIYATAGVGTSLDNSRNIGQGIAKQLKTAGVDGVILTST